MSCWRAGHHRCDITGKNKFGIVRPVEDENELMLRMINRNSPEGLKGEPPDTFEPVLEQ